ncbi:MAG TPA: NYN domain-containing protein, partial [Candidatus Saccharimonadales bacterium]|nr:NYN domain-containing protein [Candidatus Saccharimonadales bacterium]
GVTKAYMFIGYMSENEALYEYMHELGFLVVLKPTVDITPHDAKPEAGKPKVDDKDKERPQVKGNIDADLVLYAMKELPNYDQALIVSGDGDFFALVEYLEEQGKLAQILTPNWQYSSLLKPFENKIVRLDNLRKQLAYHDRKKKGK